MSRVVLLTRAEDHVVLGVRWSGLRIASRAGTSGPVLVAGDGGGRLVLTFPPQHLAEEVLREADSAAGVRDSRLSGPTVLELRVAGGTEIELSVAGLLGAASGLAVSEDESRVELPWRLLWRPRAGSGGPIVATHPASPGAPGGTSVLWRTRLGAGPYGGPFGLVADGSVAGTDDPFPLLPLSRAERRDIARWSAETPARVDRLELSALGGTLSATGRWPGGEWDHEAVLGRDMEVRTLARGFLYPLGHRAEYERRVVRQIDAAGNGASLRLVSRLTVVEPVREPSGDPRTRRLFPFGDVEITKTIFTDLDEPPGWQTFRLPDGRSEDAYFRPSSGGTSVLFPVTCSTGHGPVRFAIPLLFVKDLAPALDSASDPGLASDLRDHYESVSVTIPATRIDLVRASGKSEEGDVHEVRGFTIRGSGQSADPRPCLDRLEIALPALRTLLDDGSSHAVAFTEDFRDHGESAKAFLEMADAAAPIDVNFVGKSGASGGLAALNYSANAVSRIDGPVRARLGSISELELSPSALFKDDASLLGFPLRELIDRIDRPPAIISQLAPGRPPVITMTWSEVTFRRDHPAFKAGDGTRLELQVEISADGATTTCSVSDFRLRFPATDPLLELSFEKVTYGPGGLSVTGLRAKLLGKLKLLEDLGRAVSLGRAGPQVAASPDGVSVRYSLPLPAVSAGVFVMRNILFRTGVDVPFTGGEPEIMLGFASRRNPFVLTVLALGGGGYAELAVNRRGLRRLDAALEFGALVAVDFVIARGEAHVLGGVRLVLEAEYAAARLSGYIRIGGTVDVLGLVSVSVELRIELTYQPETNAMVGRATLIIEIDILFWSESVELDSGEWRLAGGRAAPVMEIMEIDDGDDGLAEWTRYRRCFAPVAGRMGVDR